MNLNPSLAAVMRELALGPGQPHGSPPPSVQAGEIGPAIPDLADFVVFFRADETCLTERECAELHRWLRSWFRADRHCYLIVGCSAESAREGRIQRLKHLCGQVSASGVPREAIRITEEWVEPPWQPGTSELPQDVVWLRAVAAACEDAKPHHQLHEHGLA